MFSLGADFIPFDDTERLSTTVHYFGKSMDATVRLSDPKQYVCYFLLCDLQ